MGKELDHGARHKAAIDKMSHYDMARLSRFGSSEHPYFYDKDLYEYFIARFNSLGGWTPELSKEIGWDR